MPSHNALKELLSELKQALINDELYSETLPDPEALNSLQPFCIDTLEIEQWIQFVMLPKFEHLATHDLALPSIKSNQGMANIAEVVFTQRGMKQQTMNTVLTMKKIDQLLEERA